MKAQKKSIDCIVKNKEIWIEVRPYQCKCERSKCLIEKLQCGIKRGAARTKL